MYVLDFKLLMGNDWRVGPLCSQYLVWRDSAQYCSDALHVRIGLVIQASIPANVTDSLAVGHDGRRMSWLCLF